MLNPWAWISNDPDRDPNLFEAGQDERQNNSVFSNAPHLTPATMTKKSRSAITMASIAPPSTIEELSNITWMSIPQQTLNAVCLKDAHISTALLMPKLQGRLKIMKFALGVWVTQESKTISKIKLCVETVLASDAQQLLLRGTRLDDCEIGVEEKTSWMDMWNYLGQPYAGPYTTNTLQAQTPSGNSEAHTRRPSLNNAGLSARAVVEPSSEIDLLCLDQYRAHHEGLHKVQRSIASSSKTSMDAKEQSHHSPVTEAPSQSHYRTLRRLLLLQTICEQRRMLSDRLDKMEKDLEDYGAMRNMGQVWAPAPVFACDDLDTLIDALGARIAAQEAKAPFEHPPPQRTPEAMTFSIPSECQNGSLGISSVSRNNHSSDNMSDLALRINQLRQSSTCTEARSHALSTARPLPSPIGAHENRNAAIVARKGLPDSEISSIASQASQDDSRRPSTATNNSLIDSIPSGGQLFVVEKLRAGQLLVMDPSLPKASLTPTLECSDRMELKATPVIQHSSNSRHYHQSQSSTSTLASMQSDTSTILSHLYRSARVNDIKSPPAEANDTTPKARPWIDQAHPDEETIKLLNFRRELLREWHIWNLTQMCLFKRMNAIRREYPRLRRHIAVIESIHRDRLRRSQASRPGVSTRSAEQANRDPNELRSRQRERTRQLGLARGMGLANPDTVASEGPYVLAPLAQEDGGLSHTDAMITEQEPH